LQHIKVGDELLVSRKPTGTLVIHDLKPAKNLYLFSTGTGLAPYMSLIQDIEVYDRFEKVILVHGVRKINDLAYKDFIEIDLPKNEFFGEEIRNQLIYYPTVTRESFKNEGRLTDLVKSGKLFDDIGLSKMNPEDDRAMICGSPEMLKDTQDLLDSMGFKVSPRIGEPGDYVIEHAFVEK
jgi:ferredoxin--NADP+ reductase